MPMNSTYMENVTFGSVNATTDAITMVTDPISTVLSVDFEKVYPDPASDQISYLTGRMTEPEPPRANASTKLFTSPLIIPRGPTSPTSEIDIDWDHFYHCQGYPFPGVSQVKINGGV